MLGWHGPLPALGISRSHPALGLQVDRSERTAYGDRLRAVSLRVYFLPKKSCPIFTVSTSSRYNVIITIIALHLAFARNGAGRPETKEEGSADLFFVKGRKFTFGEWFFGLFVKSYLVYPHVRIEVLVGGHQGYAREELRPYGLS